MFGRDTLTNLQHLIKPNIRYMATPDLILDLELMLPSVKSIFSIMHNFQVTYRREHPLGSEQSKLCFLIWSGILKCRKTPIHFPTPNFYPSLNAVPPILISNHTLENLSNLQINGKTLIFNDS